MFYLYFEKSNIFYLMKTKIIKNDFQIEKFIVHGNKYLYEKESWFSKNDSTNLSQISNHENENIKFDFEIPDFFNDKPKIYYKYKSINPLIPEWYKNLNKYEDVDFTNNFEDELLFN